MSSKTTKRCDSQKRRAVYMTRDRQGRDGEAMERMDDEAVEGWRMNK